jgi:hypothetical protein
MDFYAAMVKSGAFTRSALAVSFTLLYRHMNSQTGRCDPSTATLADETSLSVRGVEKAIAELRRSGWWLIDQGSGRGRTNNYAPKRPNVGSGLRGEKGERLFGLLSLENPNGEVIKPEPQFTRTSKNQSHTVDLHRPIARLARLEGASREFEAFWRVYPHRGEFPDPKKPARLKFDATLKRGIDPGQIIAGAKRYRAHVESRGIEPRFRPQAQTWLNQERWNDQLQAPEPPRLKVGMN